MEALLFLLLTVLGAAFAMAVGTYYLSYNRLVRIHATNPELFSLFLSLCSFALVIVVVYLVFLDKVLIRI